MSNHIDTHENKKMQMNTSNYSAVSLSVLFLLGRQLRYELEFVNNSSHCYSALLFCSAPTR